MGPKRFRQSCREPNRLVLAPRIRSLCEGRSPACWTRPKGRKPAMEQTKDRVWLQYFGEQEAGALVATETFIQETAEVPDRPLDDWSWHLLPSIVEIEAVLRTTPKNKAPGLDLIPSHFITTCPTKFARAVQPLFLKSLVRGRQPINGGVASCMKPTRGRGPSATQPTIEACIFQALLARRCTESCAPRSMTTWRLSCTRCTVDRGKACRCSSPRSSS